MSESTGPAKECDVVVIGGGVNGTGVFRDLALRGLKVTLVEKHDLAFGASGNSSGMIHGGPRYLTKTPEVTVSSCLDSGHIQRIAPHMLFRVPFLMPVLKDEAAAGIKLFFYDAFFRAYDRYQHLKRSKTHLSFGAEEVRALEPGLVPARGAITFDEWGLDGVRLCVANAVHGHELGGTVLLGSTVVGLIEDESSAVVGVRIRKKGAEGETQIRARAVVNATGAWAGRAAEFFGLPKDQIRVRPGKGIHVYLDRRLSNFAIDPATKVLWRYRSHSNLAQGRGSAGKQRYWGRGPHPRAEREYSPRPAGFVPERFQPLGRQPGTLGIRFRLAVRGVPTV